MWNLKRDDTNKLTKQQESHRLGNELMVTGRGEGILGELGMAVYTRLCLKSITSEDVLYSVELCSMLHRRLSGRGFGGECIWLSPFAVYMKLAQNC